MSVDAILVALGVFLFLFSMVLAFYFWLRRQPASPHLRRGGLPLVP